MEPKNEHRNERNHAEDNRDIRPRMIWVWGDTVAHEPTGWESSFTRRSTRGLLYGYAPATEIGGPDIHMVLENCIINNPGHSESVPPQSSATTFWRLYLAGKKMRHIKDHALLEEALIAAESLRVNEEARKN